MKHNLISDKFGVFDSLQVNSGSYRFVSLRKCQSSGLAPINRFPFAIRVLLESVIRNFNGKEISEEHVPDC